MTCNVQYVPNSIIKVERPQLSSSEALSRVSLSLYVLASHDYFSGYRSTP